MTQKKPVSTPFYLLSPDGFTRIPEAGPYISHEDALRDFNAWKSQFEFQGTRHGRIPHADLHYNMIESEYPFAF